MKVQSLVYNNTTNRALKTYKLAYITEDRIL